MMILDQKQFEEQEFLKWLEQGNVPVYQELAGKDMGKYKILGLRKLSFETEQQAKDYYIEKNLFDVNNMIAEKERS